jgi:2-polyprenyl-6-methoxyphenol hydroxylase-like FAD-dependent oxidoreductase
MLGSMEVKQSSSALDADVLIVGAGPAGLALVCAIGDAGLSARLLAQQPHDRA